MSELDERIDEVRRRIRSAGGDPDAIRFIAVTKGQPVDAVRRGLASGLREFGENYAAELIGKAADLGTAKPVRWHFIGQIQRNKVRKIAPVVSVYQSVDREAVACEIARWAPSAEILVQVDVASLGGVSSPPGRGGCPPGTAEALVGKVRERGLEVVGLMAVGPPGPPELARRGFRWLRSLATDLGLAEVSMGMSDDLEVAVEEGSTMVRLGRALFGGRPG